MNITEVAAWWGAIIATLVFAWDIYKWKKTGAVLDVSVSSNMEIYGNMPSDMDDKTYIIVTVANLGDRSTTITHLLGQTYKTRIHKLFNKRLKSFVVPIPTIDKALPCKIDPGERWMGRFEQDENIEKMAKDSVLYCGIYHSSSKKAILKRVIV